MRNMWRRNQLRAAIALGLATAEEKDEFVEMRQQVKVLDVALDDGSRTVLTITRRGAVSIQTYRVCVDGKTLYALSGSGLIAPTDVAEWAKTLCETVSRIPEINSLIQASRT